ncbi:MAG: hypothetical protein LBC18_07885, partial [Opitutaceae bacterium]|nr:hypothetical protein [Opitutaceae bacterium]
MNTDKHRFKASFRKSLSVSIRVHLWLNKTNHYFEQKETKTTKMKTKKTYEMKGFLCFLRFILFNKTEPINSTAKDAKNRKNETEKTTTFRISLLRVLRGYKKPAIILNREKRQNTRKRPLPFRDISRFSRFK